MASGKHNFSMIWLMPYNFISIYILSFIYLQGMDSKIRNVGYPFTYWDIATHINYKNLSFWDNAINVDRIRVDIKIDSKPNVKKNRTITLLNRFWALFFQII